jgi:four helix bundle protein
MLVKSLRDLVVWQRSLDFIEQAYRLSEKFSADERFGLTSQLRRAAVSVASNIAEGSGRFTSRDYLNFISESRGSVKEAESHLLVGARLKFVAPADIDRGLGFTDEISRMLFGLRMSIRNHARKSGT